VQPYIRYVIFTEFTETITVYKNSDGISKQCTDLRHMTPIYCLASSILHVCLFPVPVALKYVLNVLMHQFRCVDTPIYCSFTSLKLLDCSSGELFFSSPEIGL